MTIVPTGAQGPAAFRRRFRWRRDPHDRKQHLAVLTIPAAARAAPAQTRYEPASRGSPYANVNHSSALPASHPEEGPPSPCATISFSPTVPEDQPRIPPKVASSPCASIEVLPTLPIPVGPSSEVDHGLVGDARAPVECRQEPCAPTGRLWVSGEYLLWMDPGQPRAPWSPPARSRPRGSWANPAPPCSSAAPPTTRSARAAASRPATGSTAGRASALRAATSSWVRACSLGQRHRGGPRRRLGRHRPPVLQRRDGCRGLGAGQRPGRAEGDGRRVPQQPPAGCRVERDLQPLLRLPRSAWTCSPASATSNSTRAWGLWRIWRSIPPCR